MGYDVLCFIQFEVSKYKVTKNNEIILHKLKFLSTGSGVCLNILRKFKLILYPRLLRISTPFTMI